MQIAFQMDPIGEVDIAADSSFRLAEEAQNRGHNLFFYGPDQLAYQDGRITARGQDFKVQRVMGNAAKLGEIREVDLLTFDVIWLRQDPPFDMNYITSTHLLDRIKEDVLVVNDPFWVRNFPEKLLVLDLEEFIPPTAISRDLHILQTFKARYEDIIVKPLYGNGGAGVLRLSAADRNLAAIHEMFTTFSREPLIVQKFLPEVARGDKRIILVDGLAVGAINRVPAAGETRSNLHVGGRAEKVALTDRDHEICEALSPLLQQRGQIFVGIDVIGDYLTEINITSPTGIQELERFNHINVAGMIWDRIEDKVKY
ncbi:MAG: glutathione synthase [Aestuariivita sp.]|nr:glutathione synthase [Aestuariivita sp.]MCY4202016.1 glutathione synthase [Aestuariivita sp.]